MLVLSICKGRRTAGLLAALGLIAMPTSSLAINCSKVKTPVEVAICASEMLKRDDEWLSKRYFALLKEAKESGFLEDGESLHDTMIARQKEWLAQRDKTCGETARDRIQGCIADSIRARGNELLRQGFEKEGGVAPEGLMLGAERLTVVATGDGAEALQHKGRTVIEAPAGLIRPFTIYQHWDGPGTQAMLIEAGVAASAQCSTMYVVETRKPGEVVAHELGTNCAGFDRNKLKRDDRGFSLTVPPTPAVPGTTTTWIAQSGKLSQSHVRFEAVPGTSMAGLVRREKPETEGPLNDAEFDAAVNRLPADDRIRMMTALWHVENGCAGCSGPADQALYGVHIDADAVAYSGCGSTMSGVRVNCGKDDALAVWDRKTGAFYFAVAPHRDKGHHVADVVPGGPAHLYPSLGDWSAAALANLERWKSGAKWTDE